MKYFSISCSGAVLMISTGVTTSPLDTLNCGYAETKMILTDSEVASLKSAIRWWEWFGYASTAVVGLGCVGEFIAEFTSFTKNENHKHKLSRLSLIVLIFGIAGELLSAVRTSNLSGELIANIEERAGNAEQKAGAANERASQIEQDNIKLRTVLAKLQRSSGPRYFSREEQNQLVKELSKYTVTHVTIACKPNETEAARFGDDFEAVFTRLGWHPGRGWLPEGLMGDMNGKRIELAPPGITIRVAHLSKPSATARALKAALNNLDFPVSSAFVESSYVGINDLTVVIGPK